MMSLILDTTGDQAFIGLAENGLLQSKIIITEGRQLSKFLLASIQSILQGRFHNFGTADAVQGWEGGFIFDDTIAAAIAEDKIQIDCRPQLAGACQNTPARSPIYIAIGTGPGSFTGTRVGGMVAKALGFAWNIPLIPFSSSLLPDLELIASLSHEKYLLGEVSPQIELVYISPTP